MMEIWKDIKGFNDVYQVSNIGRVRSWLNGKHGLRNKPKVLSQIHQADGYLQISIGKRPGRKTMLIHRLVATAFIPNPEDKPQVNHKNSIKDDNRVENLEWCTPSQNIKHSYNAGIHTSASCYDISNPNVKLTPDDIVRIRKNNHSKTHQAIANEFNITQAAVTDIINRKSWKHIKSDHMEGKAL